MATDEGNARGGQPWRGSQPPYAPSPGWHPAQGPPSRRVTSPFLRATVPLRRVTGPFLRTPGGSAAGTPGRRAGLLARVTAAAGLAGLLAALALIVLQLAPRRFTAVQQQQITAWEYGQRWRDLPAGTIFPAAVTYPGPGVLDDPAPPILTAQRAGIAKQAGCAAAASGAAAAVLGKDGCTAVLRATYVDETDSFAVTVGAAVLPDQAAASAAAGAITRAGSSNGLGAAVRAVPVAGTAAGGFRDGQRQLAGTVSGGTYVVMYTVGYTDSRGRQQVSRDSYTDEEMTSLGRGVADRVLSVLAAPVTPPRCPGVPGC